jgi:hypothetical protein
METKNIGSNKLPLAARRSELMELVADYAESINIAPLTINNFRNRAYSMGQPGARFGGDLMQTAISLHPTIAQAFLDQLKEKGFDIEELKNAGFLHVSADYHFIPGPNRPKVQPYQDRFDELVKTLGLDKSSAAAAR